MTYNDKVGKQEQDQHTYENTAEARRVISVDESGSYVSPSGVSSYQLLMEEISATKLTYIGEAAPGTLTSAASWRIKRIDESTIGDTKVTWADGVSAFTKEWDDRATYTYL